MALRNGDIRLVEIYWIDIDEYVACVGCEVSFSEDEI